MARNSDTEYQPMQKQGHVQSVIPIKRIYQGMIITSDDRYVRILSLLPSISHFGQSRNRTI